MCPRFDRLVKGSLTCANLGNGACVKARWRRLEFWGEAQLCNELSPCHGYGLRHRVYLGLGSSPGLGAGMREYVLLFFFFFNAPNTEDGTLPKYVPKDVL